MSATSRLSHATVHVRQLGWSTVFVGLLAFSVAGFLVAPWSFEAKSIAVLHGLCAQRPSHSFWFGSDRLPFGSRMTGIYGAFLITQIYLLLRGRYRAASVPSLSVMSVLIVFIVAMGLDGVNSTLDDVRLVTIYQPSNVLRFVTGALTGTTLAVFLWLLTNNILWHVDQQRGNRVIEHLGDLAVIGLPVAGFGLLAMSGWQPIYALLALFLVGSAVLVVFELTISFVQIGRQREGTAKTLKDLAKPAVAALIITYVFMFSVAGSRFILESTMSAKPLQ
jgi:uncharacterized membrane protein